MRSKEFTELFDGEGNLVSVLVEPTLWRAIQQSLPSLVCKKEEEQAEPIGDWNNLKDCWDFKYPIDASVHCEHCGAATDDWETDNPKKFMLKTASIGGLVGFECMACKSRILKRHFKDKMVFECRPVTSCD